jgi:hypothetical protein
MAIVADIQVTGLKELEARLLELDAVAGKKLLTRTTRRSLLQFRKQAVANARSGSRSGALAEAIKIVTVTPRATQTVAVQVGPKKKDRRGVAVHNVFYSRRRRGIFYGHLVEFGFTARGRAARRVPGRPFLQPAWDATRAAIPTEFRRILAQALDRIARRSAQRSSATEGLVDP